MKGGGRGTGNRCISSRENVCKGPVTGTCLICPVSSRDRSSWNRGDGKGVARDEVRVMGASWATVRMLAFALREM